jgi:hypothetical protein
MFTCAAQESYFMDRMGLFTLRIFSDQALLAIWNDLSRTPMDALQPAETAAAAERKAATFWKVPVFIDLFFGSDLDVYLSFIANGRVAIGQIDEAAAYRRAIPGLRLALTLIPTIARARIRLRPPDLQNKILLPGQLQVLLLKHYTRESVLVAADLVPGLAFRLLESFVLGRQRGPESQRRLGRAKSFLKRKVNGQDQTSGLVEATGETSSSTARLASVHEVEPPSVTEFVNYAAMKEAEDVQIVSSCDLTPHDEP